MGKLNLSVAVRDYDRTRPLSDGVVQIDGVDPVFMALDPEEIFFRAFRRAEFDICELSMSSFTVKTAQGNCPYVGVPAFVSRAFRHTAIYVRTAVVTLVVTERGSVEGEKPLHGWGCGSAPDRIRTCDLRFRRIGSAEPNPGCQLAKNSPETRGQPDVRLADGQLPEEPARTRGRLSGPARC